MSTRPDPARRPDLTAASADRMELREKYAAAIDENLELRAEVERLRARLAAVEAALGEVWDDGNAVGLDGWVGPGRGTEPVDDEAVRRRDRAVRAALASVGDGTPAASPRDADREPASEAVDLLGALTRAVDAARAAHRAGRAGGEG